MKWLNPWKILCINKKRLQLSKKEIILRKITHKSGTLDEIRSTNWEHLSKDMFLSTTVSLFLLFCHLFVSAIQAINIFIDNGSVDELSI